MKKIIVLIFSFLFLLGANFCLAEENWDEIYESLKPADFEYMFGQDPYQTEDYLKYNLSPYPLLRTGVDFVFKDTIIPKGYYLLTPREKNGVQYVLFKQQGKVKYAIPTYKTGVVEPTFYDKYIQVPKKSWWDKVCDFGNKIVGKISKQSKKTEPMKAYIDVNQIGQDYWEIIVYYGLSKYYLLFRQN